MTNIDHEHTKKIVCPYCGYNYDHWDLEIYGEGEVNGIDCVECEKVFNVYGHLSQSFSTKKERVE